MNKPVMNKPVMKRPRDERAGDEQASDECAGDETPGHRLVSVIDKLLVGYVLFIALLTYFKRYRKNIL